MNSKDTQMTYLVVFGALFTVVPLSLALMFATSRLGAASIPIWIATAGAGWLIMKGPLGEALASRFRGDAGATELHGETVADLDELRSRVAELEERVDFSERLLARQGEPARLEGPR